MDQSSGGKIMGMLAAKTADVGYFVRLGHIASSPREIIFSSRRMRYGVNVSTGNDRRQLVKLLVFSKKITGV